MKRRIQLVVISIIMISFVLFSCGKEKSKENELDPKTYKVISILEKPLTEVEKKRFESKKEKKYILTKIESEGIEGEENEGKHTREEWKYKDGNLIYYKNTRRESEVEEFNNYADIPSHEISNFEMFITYDEYNRKKEEKIIAGRIYGNGYTLKRDERKGEVFNKYKYDERGRLSIQESYINDELIAKYLYMYKVYEDGSIKEMLRENTLHNEFTYRYREEYDSKGNILKKTWYSKSPKDENIRINFKKYKYDNQNRWILEQTGESYMIHGNKKSEKKVLINNEIKREYISDTEYIEISYYVNYEGEGKYDRRIEDKTRIVMFEDLKSISKKLYYGDKKDREKVTWRIDYFRDEKYNLLESIFSYEENGKIYKEKRGFYKYKYEYDKNNNKKYFIDLETNKTVFMRNYLYKEVEINKFN